MQKKIGHHTTRSQYNQFKETKFLNTFKNNYLAYLKDIHNFYFSSKCRLFFDFSLGSIPANFLYQLWYATMDFKLSLIAVKLVQKEAR
jgi:hypothetical protein